jgi:heme/copper-type cytochrome/quinol oxidase subunit 2
MTRRRMTRVMLGGVLLGAAAVLYVSRPDIFMPRLVAAGQEQGAIQRDVTITAKKYAYNPGRIEVNQNDLVRITLRSEDIPHSFTIDAYRIAKRVANGQTVTFEFRADQAGTFPIYCNLRQEDGCRNMRGELVVHGK